MIFVTAGTVHFPFPRLFEVVFSISQSYKKKQTIIMQTGAYHAITSVGENFFCKPFFTQKEMIQYFSTADIVIAAAGEATLFQILRYSQFKPILFPRLKKYHEHVDDQQLAIAKAAELKKMALFATNKSELKKLLLSKKKDVLNSYIASHSEILIANLDQLANSIITK